MNRRQFLGKSSVAALGAMALRTRASAMPAVLAPSPESQRARLDVVWGDRVGKINRNIYGHFAEHLGSCIYDAMWVGVDSSIPNYNGLRKDTIEALKHIHAPILRWPGGCFADQYHWRDGVGPREKRPRTWNIWWGRDEGNAFGTDEFLEYCRLSGVEPYLCANVGSGSPEEALDWMMYCNGKESTTVTALRAANGHPEPYKVRYWSVGNENWGCGGNFDAETYAHEYARFVTYLGRYAERGTVEFVACGDFREGWNQKFFETLLHLPAGRRAIRNVQQLSVHHYFRGGLGQATQFTDEEYYRALAGVAVLEARLEETIGLIQHYTTSQNRVGIALDEWGIWHPVPGTGAEALWQSNTLRDALLAAVTFNSLNSYGEAVSMANIAQTFNVLQCIAFTKGPKFALTPTYHVFDLYQPHMDAMALKTVVDSPTYTVKPLTQLPPEFLAFLGGGGETKRTYLSASASLNEAQKQICVTLVNQHLTEPLEVEIRIPGLDSPGVRGGSVRELTSGNVRDENTLDKPDVVHPSAPKELSVQGNKFTHIVPPHALETLLLQVA
ncbi:MAG: alpha-N-arabinofuranosidase [Acidobacteriia bacterium]|nr:alpha-N-arabinofuranosidase [Terriglobia bacterium]